MSSVKRELLLGIGLLLGIQVAMAFSAIALLSRMAPAIDRILQENVVSIEAAEEMLAVLAMTPEEVGPGGSVEARFFEALGRARANVTEDSEPAILDRIEEGYRALLRGETERLAPTVTDLQALVDVNREAMRRTRDQASRLSEAGAWAVVILAVLSSLAGVVIVVRVQRRVLAPLEEIYASIQSASQGDPHRRCQYRDAPEEMRQLMAKLNEVLDERFGRKASQGENDLSTAQ